MGEPRTRKSNWWAGDAVKKNPWRTAETDREYSHFDNLDEETTAKNAELDQDTLLQLADSIARDKDIMAIQHMRDRNHSISGTANYGPELGYDGASLGDGANRNWHKLDKGQRFFAGGKERFNAILPVIKKFLSEQNSKNPEHMESVGMGPDSKLANKARDGWNYYDTYTKTKDLPKEKRK